MQDLDGGLGRVGVLEVERELEVVADGREQVDEAGNLVPGELLGRLVADVDPVKTSSCTRTA
jgi:hypothetical protein